MSFLLLAAPAGACDLATVDALVAAGEVAFVRHEDERLAAAVEAVDRELWCLRTPVPPRWCAKVHYLHGLLSWADGDREGAIGAFRAAQHAEPMFHLPESVVPATHVLWRLWWQAEETPDRWTTSSRFVRIDGLPSAAVPEGQPWISQKSTAKGATKGARWNQGRPNDKGGASGAGR